MPKEASQDGFKLDADDYIVKPFDPEELSNLSRPSERRPIVAWPVTRTEQQARRAGHRRKKRDARREI